MVLSKQMVQYTIRKSYPLPYAEIEENRERAPPHKDNGLAPEFEHCQRYPKIF
jgi:hypothetical protein